MNGSKLFHLYFILIIILNDITSGVAASDYDDDTDDTFACGKLDFQCEKNGRCLSRTLFCNDKYDCENKYDENYCHSGSCSSNLWRCNSNNGIKCIPRHWRCNGFSDCNDGSDEVGCDSHMNMTTHKEDGKKSSAKRNLIKWFLMRRKTGSTTNKWGHELPRTAVALFLGNKGIFTHGNSTMEEMSYEMTIRLLTDMSRGNGHLKRNDLALYIHAMMVTCIDPRNFHGRDLVSELRRKVESSSNRSSNPFEILALCNAGDKMTEKDVERIKYTYMNRSRPFWIDNQAMATIALACIHNNNNSDVPIDERTLINIEKELKMRQFRNGTVENLKTTALVIQALIATQSYDRDFDLDAAIKFIHQNQKADGSIGSFLESYYILPALSNSSLIDITSEHCKRSSISEEEALSELQRQRGKKISTQFSVWVGNDTDIKRSWTLKVPVNSTFYDILEMANKLDTRQRIVYNVINGKPYVSSMIGLQDDIEMGIYWFMYVRPQNTEEDPKLVEESPVDVNIGPNQELILWYKSS